MFFLFYGTAVKKTEKIFYFLLTFADLRCIVYQKSKQWGGFEQCLLSAFLSLRPGASTFNKRIVDESDLHKRKDRRR